MLNHSEHLQRAKMKAHLSCKSFTTGLVYLSLMTSFLFGYFYDITSDYLERKVTTSKRLKYVKDLDFPTLIICPMPGFKPAVKSITTYPDGRGWWYNQSLALPDDTDLWELYKNLSYIMERDIKLTFSNPLLEKVNDYTYEETATVQGMCYKLTSSTARLTNVVAQNDYINLEFLKDEDYIPQNLEIYLASNMSWLGVSNNYWPVFQPSALMVRRTETILAHLYQTDHTSLDGHENVDGCLQKLLENRNCSKICFPMIYNHLDLEPCQTFNETECIISLDYYEEYRLCYIPKYRSSYGIRTQRVESDKSNTKFTFVLALGSDYITLEDEVYVMEFSQYIGSVGGTLGMFVGFSFFSYIKSVIDLFSRS